MKIKIIVGLVVLVGIGIAVVSNIDNKPVAEPELTEVESDMPKEVRETESVDLNNMTVTEVEQVELNLPEIETPELEPIELTEIKLPQAHVELPEIKQLETPDVIDESLPLDYEDPGSAETVIVGNDNVPSNSVRTLKVDPQVIQSVEQQTGIPSADIEQAFTQD